MAGTLIGEALGSTLPAKLVVGCLGAMIGAFLTAPGRNRRRRIVAVALLIALIHLFRRAGDAFASERRGWVPANWVVVGVCAAVGFAGGSAVTTARGGWDTDTTPAPPSATVELPDVAGKDRAEARAILRKAGVRSDPRTESSPTVAAGQATRTIPRAGTTVDRGTRVTLMISTGPIVQTVEIPDVSHQPRADAFAALEQRGLKPEEAKEDSDQVAEGAATRTEPAAGKVVNEGTTVTVFISSGPPPLLVPKVAGLAVGDAQAQLEGLGLEWTTDYVESADVPPRNVIDSEPAEGQEIEPGGSVKLIVSCGSSCIG